MPLPSKPTDELLVLVFGPGTGELIVVFVPPADWLVVDACGVESVSYGLEVLQHYVAEPSIVLLTHPHLDHAKGLPAVLDRVLRGAPESWPTLGFLPPANYAADTHEDGVIDYELLARSGETEDAIAKIVDAWERAPACMWRPAVGEPPRRLGEATLNVLSPSARTYARRPSDPNRLSTALLLEWRGRRVVLGSDLTRAGWTEALRSDPTLVGHDLLKVPHHGSQNAQHPEFVDADAGPALWLLTPFGGRLPRFHADGPIDRMLGRVGEVHLSALPRPHPSQAGSPLRLERSTLEADPDVVFDPVTSGFPDCFVAVVLPEHGPPRLTYGDGSVVVTSGSSRC